MDPQCSETGTRSSLYNIGYEGLDAESLVNKLKARAIDLLMDVREKPVSHKRGFSKRPLAEALERHGIEYRHMPVLGCPSEIRRRFKATGDFPRLCEEYLVHLREHLDELIAVCKLVEAHRCCLLCYERDPEACHRRLAAVEIQRLNRNGSIEVIHL